MDSRGRVWDNIFVERLWRTVKYEEVYLKSYNTVKEARDSLTTYFHFYNTERIHESLGYRTPCEIYFGQQYKEESVQADLIHLKTALFFVLTMGRGSDIVFLTRYISDNSTKKNPCRLT
jgi:putative transposase